MRLRRETGDWTIRVDDSSAKPGLLTTQLPKGLSAEDFVGSIIEFDRGGIVNYDYALPTSAQAGMPYNVMIQPSAVTSFLIYYDRRSGHLSLDPADFDPVEGAADFIVTSESGSAISPTVLDAGLTADYFVGKTVQTNKGLYTITSDMISESAGDPILAICYTGNRDNPTIIYHTSGETAGRVLHHGAASAGGGGGSR